MEKGDELGMSCELRWEDVLSPGVYALYVGLGLAITPGAASSGPMFVERLSPGVFHGDAGALLKTDVRQLPALCGV